MTDSPAFRVVRGLDENISQQPYKDGYVYFATDTKKIYLDANEQRTPMGGNTGIYYGKADFTDEFGPVFIFNFQDIDGDNIPNINDLILNGDGSFYKVTQVIIEDEEILTEKLTIAGGSNTGPSVPVGKLTAEISFDEVVLVDEKVLLKVIIRATDADGIAIDDGRYEIKLKGVVKKQGRLINSAGEDEVKENLIDLTELCIGEDTYNFVLICYGDTGGLSESFVKFPVKIQMVKFTTKWDYDDTTINSVNSDFTMIWNTNTITGYDYYANIIIDDIYAFDIKETMLHIPKERLADYGLKHGAHKIELQSFAQFNGNLKASNKIIKNVIFYDNNPNVTDYIIACDFFETHIQQYDTITLPVMIYHANNINNTAMITFKAGNKIVELTNCKNLTKYNFTYTPETSGLVSLQFLCGGTSLDLNLNVESVNINVQEVPDYAFKFKASSFANNNDVQQWTCNNKKIIFSDNFDWINGGLRSDDTGSYFKIQAGSFIEIPYFMFEQDLKDTGGCFKIIFKASNCRDYDASVIECTTIETFTEEIFDEEGNLIETEVEKNIGLNIKAQSGEILSRSAVLQTQYYEDSYIEYEFDICKYSNNPEDQYLTVWMDGIPAGVKESTSANSFRQGNPKNLKIGSEDCDVYIYLIKFYKKHLNFEEHLINFIADAPNSSEMIARFNRNNITATDKNGNVYISPELLAEKNPDCNVYIYELPEIPTKKLNEKKGQYVTGTYTQLKGSKIPIRTFDEVKVGAQGTSSMSYGISAYNFDTKFSEKWSMDENAIPVDYFNTKVNVASCESANNALNQEWYNEYQPYKTRKRLQQRNDGKIARDTMQFQNGVIFITDKNKKTEESSAIQNNVFKEIEGYVNEPYPRLYSVCNMGNSKKNIEVFHGAGNQYECCLEVTDNNSSGQRMIIIPGFYVGNSEQGIGSHEVPLQIPDEVFDDDGFVIPGVDWGKTVDQFLIDRGYTEEEAKVDNKTMWINALTEDGGPFGFRYSLEEDDFVPTEEFPTFNDYYQCVCNRFLRLVRWFAKNNPSQATNEPFSEPKKVPDYVIKGVGKTAYSDYPSEYEVLAGTKISGKEFTKDTAEYRALKMLQESEKYLILDSVIYHYIFIERHSMVDNVAKNTFWNTEDGIHWELTKNYDNDTADGINNNGDLSLTYGMEIMDTADDGSNIFNASSSAWLNFVHQLTVLKDKMYSILNNRKAWSAELYLEKFTDWQNKIPEICWIEDFKRKYFRPYIVYNDESYFSRLANGKKTHQRRQFEVYQEQYMNSKYKTNTGNDLISWRSGQPKDAAIIDGPNQGKYEIKGKVKLYAHGYFSMAIASGAGEESAINIHIRGKKGEEIEFSKIQDTQFDDATCYVYSPMLYQEFVNIETLYPVQFTAAAAKKLRKISLIPQNESQKKMLKNSLSVASNIEEIILKDCINANFELNLEECNRLKKIDTTGSQFTSYTIADGAPLIEFKINNPESLILTNLRYLKQQDDNGEKLFDIASYNRLRKIIIKNIDYHDVNSKNILTEIIKTLRDNNTIEYELKDVKWTFNENDVITDENDNLSIKLLDTLLTKGRTIGIVQDEQGNIISTKKADSLTGIAKITNACYSGSKTLSLYEKYGLKSEDDTTYPNLILDFLDENNNSKLYTINIENGDGQIVWTRQVENFNTLTNDILSNSAFGAFDATAAIVKSYSNEFIYNFANSWEYVIGDQIFSIEPALEQGEYQYLDISKLQGVNETNITIRPVYVTETRYYTIQICNEWGEKIHEAKVEYKATFEEVRPPVLPLIDDSNLELDQTYYLKGYGTVRTDNSIINEQDWIAVSDLTLYTKFEQKSVYEIDYSSYLDIDETGTILGGLKKNKNNEYIYQGEKIVIPKTIKVIASEAFGVNQEDGAQIAKTNLTKVFFENGSSLINIESYAFGYSNLKYFEFVDSIQTIGLYAFRSCNLQAKYYNGILKLPTSLNKIGEHSFNGSFGSGSNLSQNQELIVKIPSNVTEIDSYGLAHWGTIKATIDIGSSTNFSNLNLEKTQGSNAIISTNGDGTYDIYNINFYTKKYNPDSIINGRPISTFFKASNPNYNITINYINE